MGKHIEFDVRLKSGRDLWITLGTYSSVSAAMTALNAFEEEEAGRNLKIVKKTRQTVYERSH